MSFRIAMQSRRAIAALHRPHEVVDQSYEFLIAERRSHCEELLFLSDAGASRGSSGRAPRELTPRHVLIGTLVNRGPEAGMETFLLNRFIPESARFQGLFLPADGYLKLSRSSVGILLSGICRLGCSAGTDQSMAVQTIAQAYPKEPGIEGCVCHLDAAYIPWAQEVLPHEIPCQAVKGDCQ